MNTRIKVLVQALPLVMSSTVGALLASSVGAALGPPPDPMVSPPAIVASREFPRLADYASSATPTTTAVGVTRTLPATPTMTATFACTATPTPTVTAVLPASPLATAEEQPEVVLTTDKQIYPAGEVTVLLALTNHGAGPLYLRICGPWEVVNPAEPDRPVWTVACEIDYLGHRVEAGASFTDSLSVRLLPGIYSVQTPAYSDCTLGEPKRISARETYYGNFSDCARRQTVTSPQFAVVPCFRKGEVR